MVSPNIMLAPWSAIVAHWATCYVAFEDLFVLILYVPSKIFQLCRDGSSWVEPVVS